MPTRALPTAAQTQLEHILADTERGLIAAESLTMTVEPERAGDLLFLHATDRRADEQLRLALAAAAQIVDVIGALAWPATDRRKAVETWHTKVRMVCAIDPPVFIAARRQEPWWDQFQQRLQRESTHTRRQVPAKLPAWVKQLREWRKEAGLPLPKLAEALGVDDATLKSHLRGAVRTLQSKTRHLYVKGFSRLLNRPVTFD